MKIFVRQIKSRSAEHERAVKALSHARAPGQIVAVLRQELDSLVRVIYLLSLPLERRHAFISALIEDSKWKKENQKGIITDREMVDTTQQLHGWTQAVYKFGCAFIHLSALHDHEARDPLALLPASERDATITYCRYYHGDPTQEAPEFKDLEPFLPHILRKISKNLDHYLDDLISGKSLNID